MIKIIVPNSSKRLGQKCTNPKNILMIQLKFSIDFNFSKKKIETFRTFYNSVAANVYRILPVHVV